MCTSLLKFYTAAELNYRSVQATFLDFEQEQKMDAFMPQGQAFRLTLGIVSIVSSPTCTYKGN